jgi:NTP pyrophosphatase (non-canonical NTP hydrolase)
LDVFKDIQLLITWIGQNAGPLLIGLAAVAVLLLRLRHRGDRAERVFRRAGLRVSNVAIRQLRDEFARAAVDTERQRVFAENKQQLEVTAIEAEKTRILGLVRNTPSVVKEVGEVLRAIEHEYEQGLRTVKSDQAREGLRRAAEKQIQAVLSTVSNDPGHLPQFHIADSRDHEPSSQHVHLEQGRSGS